MDGNNKTAVSGLFEELEKYIDPSQLKYIKLKLKRKFIEIEKKQIIDSICWARNPFNAIPNDKLSELKAEKYYNEIYGI